jgi:hypothetical protein
MSLNLYGIETRPGCLPTGERAKWVARAGLRTNWICGDVGGEEKDQIAERVWSVHG